MGPPVVGSSVSPTLPDPLGSLSLPVSSMVSMPEPLVVPWVSPAVAVAVPLALDPLEFEFEDPDGPLLSEAPVPPSVPPSVSASLESESHAGAKQTTSASTRDQVFVRPSSSWSVLLAMRQLCHGYGFS